MTTRHVCLVALSLLVAFVIVVGMVANSEPLPEPVRGDVTVAPRVIR